MWTYIFRRLVLMIPTLFGITIVSFIIMQLAPGDPLMTHPGAGGLAGEAGQTREAYLIQKRDLKLDRPLVLNINYFRDFRGPVAVAAHYKALSRQEILAELEQLARGADDPLLGRRLAFLQSLRIPRFDERLRPPDLSPQQLQDSGLTAEQWLQEKQRIRTNLAETVQSYVQVWCEDLGHHGAPAAIDILRSPDSTRRDRIGAMNCLAAMVGDPFVYTYSRRPTPEESRQVEATWARLWEQEKDRYPPLDPDRRRVLEDTLQELVHSSRTEMFQQIQGPDLFADDAPFFADVVLDEERTLEEKAAAAEFLRLYISRRIRINAPVDADEATVGEVAENWLSLYEATKDQYHYDGAAKAVYLFTDTQYAHMVRRLATFDFGRSAMRTREPVSSMIWDAVLVSAPLMVMAQLVIYLVAIPLGVLCSVNRGNLIDRLTTLALFFLYSVPAFVAGMLFLLFFAYGDYVNWFPMQGLHSPGAENFGIVRYMLDYLWHAFLPVVCLSLFSLAGLAMYSRSSMLDVLGQDYIRTARAKGVTWSKVVLKHGLRNGLIPIITLFANFLPAMLGGAVLIEYIFNIPGMGRLTFTSIEQKDFPVLMALIYINAIVVMLSILMTDLLYVLVDPRISFGKQGKSS